MPKIDFSVVATTFKDDYEKLTLNQDKSKRTPTNEEQKTHDLKVYAVLNSAFEQVRKYYEQYDKNMVTLKEQAKHHADAIENTIKTSKGQPTEAQVKLLLQSQEAINTAFKAVEKLTADEFSLLSDWRGGWESSARKVLFNHAMVARMVDFRSGVIAKQAKDWNPVPERLKQYKTRAEVLIQGVLKAKGKGPSPDSANELKRITEALEACMASKGKGNESLAQTLGAAAKKLAVEVKQGLTPTQVKDAKNVFKGKQKIYEQYESYRKTFSGLVKTLSVLDTAAAGGLKTATKDTQSDWKQLKGKIESELKNAKEVEKCAEECIKYANKMTELFNKAIKG